MSLSSSQLETAAIITKVGSDLGATREQIQAAIAGAWVESRLGVLDGGDNGTAWGIFQQREVSDWGSKSRVENPYNAAQDFFLGHGSNKGLLDKWNDSLSPGRNVQNVQRSAFPSRYDTAFDYAGSVLNQIEGYASDVVGSNSVQTEKKQETPIDLNKPTAKTSQLNKFVLLAVGTVLILAAGVKLSS